MMNNEWATLSQEFSGRENEFRILPAGVFRANDGRPANLPGWRIDSAIAGRLIAAAAQRADDLVIDYEHQTLKATANGQPAPAAGWFKTLAWREGAGLFAQEVRWTDKARAMLKAGEYRYVSPVFAFDPATGEIRSLHSIALTNTPALSGLLDLGALSINSSPPQTAEMVAGSDSPHAIQSFNHVFGQHGCFHPDTLQAEIEVRLKAETPPRLSDDFVKSDPRGADALRRAFPDVFA